jgi:hypothetical protein
MKRFLKGLMRRELGVFVPTDQNFMDKTRAFPVT